nr:MAG TPA: hypothetical protein [Caudoviricetes sp.]
MTYFIPFRFIVFRCIITLYTKFIMMFPEGYEYKKNNYQNIKLYIRWNQYSVYVLPTEIKPPMSNKLHNNY